MTHRTQLSQPDEALRRAQHDDTVRQLITEIADYLTIARPLDSIREASRLYLASAKSVADNAMDSDRAAELLRSLLATMPVPYASETRGEYAIRLRAAAGSMR
jgi:hypothetical protein